MIGFNKHLMHKDRFPFPVALTTCHMGMTLLLCNVLYFVKPSLFPSMRGTQGHELTLVKWFVPLGCLFAVGLCFSNKAYLYCSVTFLQFLKECNVAVVFIMCVLIGLQHCTRSRCFVLFWIVLGASLAVHGEVHFVWVGFGIQVISQLAECSKTVLGEIIMQGPLKLDALTYTRYMAPVCFAVLLMATAVTWEHEVVVRGKEWWRLLLPNACMAFLLNVLAPMIIKDCSALTFMITGLIKDMVIVLASSVVFGEVVVRQQIIGFIVCLAGILFWSHMRLNPESPSVRGLQVHLGEAKADPDECVPLILRKCHKLGP